MSKKKRARHKKTRPQSTPRSKETPQRIRRSSVRETLGKALLFLRQLPLRQKLGFLVVLVLVSGISLSAKSLFFSQRGALAITYPFDGSLFPPEIIPPTIWWEDGDSDATRWHVSVEFEGQYDPIHVDVDTTRWIPDEALWESIKAQTRDTPARLTVSSLVSFAGMSRTLSSQTISISTSSDSVGAPIFFREVPLPFLFATENLTMIKWRLGNIGSHEPPPVILSDLPSCGNCHSFSADGTMLGMDVDVANDKGAYILTPFEEETVFSREKIFSWNDYYPSGGSVRTFGLLARVSPDGRYVVGGMKDRAVFIPRPDLEYSQLFFPVSGSLAYYDNDDGTIDMLPGADDDQYVQTNAAWTSDGQYVTYARGNAPPLTTTAREHQASLSPSESAEVLGGPQYLDESGPGYKKFLFDLYSVPFNNGSGGVPVPVEGASGNGKSNYFPKYSPDGKWLVFNQAESFMLLMPDSRLYIMPAEGGEPRLMNCNTESMNSWHSWSPNSKWLVFASKQFSPYTQIFLTHVDENGIDSPPVLVENFIIPDRAANIPEFVNIEPESERMIEEQFVDDNTFLRHGLRLDAFGRTDEAQEQYLESLRINPDNAESKIGLGIIYARKRQFDDAEETVGGIPEHDPLFYRALYVLGGIHAEQGEFAEAIEVFRRGLTVRNVDPLFKANVHFNLGRCLVFIESYDEAAEEFQSALRLDPQRAEAFAQLGNIKMRKGDVEGAIGDFESALKLNPSLEGLREAVIELRSRRGGDGNP